MSSIASNGWNSHSNTSSTARAMALPKDTDEPAIRNRLSNLRDTLLVLGLQIVFRATLILRRWNY
jgi:hypothetical protein